MTRPIFIISLPRSGSTLLQRLLMSDGRAATLGEPSLLLRFLGEGDLAARRSVYGEFLVDIAVDDMRKHWPGYDDSYRDGVRRLILDLYTGLADGKEWFIDKTPRYTLIADEILKTFPDAKFIVLWRHPLAVVASMANMTGKDFWFPEEHSIDLYQGLLKLAEFTEQHKESCCVTRYEDLVAKPMEELARIGDYLGWEGLEQTLDKQLPSSAGGTLGDPTGTHKFSQVSTDSLEGWHDAYHNLYRTHWARNYVRDKRADIMKSMGYELPDGIAKSSKLGLPSLLRDWAKAWVRRRRRITKPKWVERSRKHYRETHEVDVMWK
ncbi:MAG: sulfotransferase family protein [Luteolibacter sp.]